MMQWQSHIFRLIIGLVLGLELSGCAVINIQTYSAGTNTALCNRVQGEKVALYWGGAWRPDQKEVVLREVMIQEEFKRFLTTQTCFEFVTLSRHIEGQDILMVRDRLLVADAKTQKADWALRLRYEEVSPNLFIYLSPILWQTQNEIRLHLRLINTHDEKVWLDLTSLWTRGGAFTTLGTDSLRQDLQQHWQWLFLGQQPK